MKLLCKFIPLAAMVTSVICPPVYSQTVSTGKVTRLSEQFPEVSIPLPLPMVTPMISQQKVKPKLMRSQLLPGIGEMPGRKDYFKPVIVRSSNNRTEIIDIAFDFQNRLSTPFLEPKIIDQSKSDIAKDGQSIYIRPTDMNPFTIFVTGSGVNDPVISLTLVPKKIPSQTILVQVDKPDTAASSVAADEDRPASDAYTEGVRYVFRQMALGKIPAGYAEAPLPRSVAAIRGLVVRPMTRYSGPSADIYAYRIENNGIEPIALEENEFMQKGVRAVSFFPTATVSRGVSTMAYIFATKADE
jgi:conjugal transfer pilus assembly protein TraK